MHKHHSRKQFVYSRTRKVSSINNIATIKVSKYYNVNVMILVMMIIIVQTEYTIDTTRTEFDIKDIPHIVILTIHSMDQKVNYRSKL